MGANFRVSYVIIPQNLCSFAYLDKIWVNWRILWKAADVRLPQSRDSFSAEQQLRSSVPKTSKEPDSFRARNHMIPLAHLIQMGLRNEWNACTCQTLEVLESIAIIEATNQSTSQIVLFITANRFVIIPKFPVWSSRAWLIVRHVHVQGRWEQAACWHVCVLSFADVVERDLQVRVHLLTELIVNVCVLIKCLFIKKKKKRVGFLMVWEDPFAFLNVALLGFFCATAMQCPDKSNAKH